MHQRLQLHNANAPTTTAVRVLLRNVDITKPRLTMQLPQTK